METKVCTSCQQQKPLSAFARNKKMSSGRLNQCQTCRNSKNTKKLIGATPAGRQRLSAYRERYRAKYPEKRHAERVLHAAINSGAIVRQPCEVCGDPKSHGHHDDYSKPLAVRWLCPAHHMKVHRELREAA